MKIDIIYFVKDNRSGHRQRLRKRFLAGGIDSFLDYEIVELLLTLGSPRKDCKNQAKELIKKFKTLNAVLEARPEELQKIKGVGPNNIFGIKFFQALLKKYYQEKIFNQPILNSLPFLIKFLQQQLIEEKKEVFMAILLNSRYKLIRSITISTGTVDKTIIHPREIFKEAFLASASFIILAHNHPSGDITPSKEDIQITKRLLEVGKIMGVEILDHVIISKNYYFSFKEKGLIKRELDF